MGDMHKRTLILLAIIAIAFGIVATRQKKHNTTPPLPKAYYLHILNYGNGKTEIVFEWMKWGDCPPNGFAISRNKRGDWQITQWPQQDQCSEKIDTVINAILTDLEKHIPASPEDGKSKAIKIIEVAADP